MQNAVETLLNVCIKNAMCMRACCKFNKYIFEEMDLVTAICRRDFRGQWKSNWPTSPVFRTDLVWSQLWSHPCSEIIQRPGLATITAATVAAAKIAYNYVWAHRVSIEATKRTLGQGDAWRGINISPVW